MKKPIICTVILCLMLGMAAFTPSGVSVTGYEADVDYMALMLNAAADGSTYAMAMGAIYEKQRELKIIDNGYVAPTTNFFQTGDSPGVVYRNLLNYINQMNNPVHQNTSSSPTIEYYTKDDVFILANIVYHEARGISRGVELACVVYTACNRVDAGYGSLREVITAPYQFAYVRGANITDSPYYNRCYEIASAVLKSWNAEKNGKENTNRCLPQDYLWFSGDGRHNYFRNAYRGGAVWNYSLPDAYSAWDL